MPPCLAVATGVGAIASAVLGRLYERFGTSVILGGVLVTAAFSPLVFLLPAVFTVVGMVSWGIGMVMPDMLLGSVISGVLPEEHRNLSLGLFFVVYGLGLAVGATVSGLLYERSRVALVGFAVAVQAVSLPLFALADRAHRRRQLGPC